MVVELKVIIILILVVLFQHKVIHFWKFGFTVLFAIINLDTLYFNEAVSTYTYIFVDYKRHAKLRKISHNGRINHDQFKFIIPTLVITTCFLFSFPKLLGIFHDDNAT